MSDLEERDPASVEPEPIEEEDDGRSTFMVVAQLFLIPLAIISASVGLFVLFSLMTGESRDPSEYLAEVRSGSKTRRFPAAYELAKVLATEEELASEPRFVSELARTFVETRDEEPEVRRYLALALGQVADPLGLNALLSGLDDPDAQTRIYVVWALGAVGDPRAVPPLVEQLKDPDPGVRKMASYSLGGLGDPRAVPSLEAALEDDVVDVQWNAALSLGQMGHRTALPVLHRMLDREYLDRVEGITPEQKQAAMINAIRALAILEDPGSIEVLSRLSRADPSLEVRSVALDAIQDRD